MFVISFPNFSKLANYINSILIHNHHKQESSIIKKKKTNMSKPNSPTPSNEEDSNIVKSYDPPVSITKNVQIIDISDDDVVSVL